MVCKECKQDKELSEFYLKSNGKIRSSYCKKCFNIKYKNTKETNKNYYEKNKEKILLHNKEYHDSISDQRKKYLKDYRDKNKEKIRQLNKKWREDNKEEWGLKKKEYYQNNKDAIQVKKRENYHKNIDRYRDQKRNYVNNKLKEDNLFKLKFSIRSLIRNAFNRKFTIKSKKTSDILGCTFDEFKYYIESKFTPEMNWGNYGTYWHLDHIKPVDLAKNEEEVIELNHYTNFQPLHWRENILKSNKYQE